MLSVIRALRHSGSPKGKALFLIVALIAWILYFFSARIFDRTSPELLVDNVSTGQVLREAVSLLITATDEKAGVKYLYLQIDDGPVQTLQRLKKQTTGRKSEYIYDLSDLTDGSHRILITAVDNAFRQNEKQVQLDFAIDLTPPQVKLKTKPKVGTQGNTLALFIVTNEPLKEIQATLFGKNLPLYPLPTNPDTEKKLYWYRSLVGVGVSQQAGYHSAEIIATDLAGNQSEQVFILEIGETEFEQGGYIKLSPEKQKVMLDRSKSLEDNAKRAKAYAVADQTAEQLWVSPFVRPAPGTLTSPFGKYREYNTGVKRHHLGTDIANQTGTAIYAGSSGVVTLAERLHIYGNSIIINHGQGVSTSYNHLSEIEVAVGDKVEKNQQIGLMGATGQVTGPHLHWHMAVNGVAVAPEQWIEVSFSTPKHVLDPIEGTNLSSER
jgi:murein DD-endopeptidase MepM/ murein hydrolase activator NlpD